MKFEGLGWGMGWRSGQERLARGAESEPSAFNLPVFLCGRGGGKRSGKFFQVAHKRGHGLIEKLAALQSVVGLRDALAQGSKNCAGPGVQDRNAQLKILG